jgi:hypothetical protein
MRRTSSLNESMDTYFFNCMGLVSTEKPKTETLRKHLKCWNIDSSCDQRTWTGYYQHTRINIHSHAVYGSWKLLRCSTTYSHWTYYCVSRKVCWNVLLVGIFICIGTKNFLKQLLVCYHCQRLMSYFINLQILIYICYFICCRWLLKFHMYSFKQFYSP